MDPVILINPSITKVTLFLVVGALIAFLPACLPVHTGGTATLPVTATLPTATQEVTPSPTITVVPSTSTLTPIPFTLTPTETQTPAATATSAPPVVFAAIGDYGSGEQAEGELARLVLSWNPDFIITLGDNNYPDGSAGHIDAAIGQFFHSYIYPYTGAYGEGADTNRFFPSLGNHDTQTKYGQPYYDYFTLPGNERYYDFVWGPLHLFALDDINSEPDGVGVSSKQAEWLKAGLEASTSPWNIVYMHMPPYSSGQHGSTDWAQWPYGEWGADAVLAGHDHSYERLEVDGLVYFVNGLGGYGRYSFPDIVDGSQVRYNAGYGAMRIEAMDYYLKFEFITFGGEVVDSYEINK